MDDDNNNEIIKLKKKYRITAYDLVNALSTSEKDGYKKSYAEYIKDEWLKRTEPD